MPPRMSANAAPSPSIVRAVFQSQAAVSAAISPTSVQGPSGPAATASICLNSWRSARGVPRW